MNPSQILEAVMLVCFGLAWPLATLKMMRRGRAEGRGLAFTLVILAGYVAGALSKLLAGPAAAGLPPVFWLYVLNTISVGANAALQWRLSRHPPSPPPATPSAAA
ncbi:MAG: hypothetical protein KGN16_25495 [Burkholderiales bacterium]|nr:hypothetical protein [Burkholderiales bacterium]